MSNESLGKARDQIFRKININEDGKRDERGAKNDDSTQRSLSIASHEMGTHRAANSEEEMHEEHADGPRAERRNTSGCEERAAQSDASDSEQRGEELAHREPARFDLSLLEDAMKEAEAKPKITIWNKDVSAVMRYMQMTTPRYSISSEASDLMAKAVKKAYPDVWKAIEEKTTSEQEWIDLSKKRRKATILRR